MPEVEPSNSTPTKPSLTDLRVVRPKVQASPIDRRLLAKKLGLVSEPQPETPEDAAPAPVKRRRKRDVFLSLFKPSDASIYKRKAPPAATVAIKVPVKLPIPYRSGEHLGVLVSGARVPFSRPMHLTRRAMIMLEANRDGAIPEEEELLQGFPARLSIEDLGSDVASIDDTRDE